MIDDLPNLPTNVKQFLLEMAPFTEGVAEKDGKVIILVKDENMKTPVACRNFLKLAGVTETKYDLGTYTKLVLNSVPSGLFTKIKGITLQINVKDMMDTQPKTEIVIAPS